MLEELNCASERLKIALDEYLSVCTFIRDSYLEGDFRTNNEHFYNYIESEQQNSLRHKIKLGEAQAAINAIRNTRPATHVNSLPPEILIRIFSLLVNDRRCLIGRHYIPPESLPGSNYIKYPDSLSHVSSSWRRLTTSIPHFWSHIDIALNHPLNPALFERAKLFIARSGEVPLGIHIWDPCCSRKLALKGVPTASKYDQNILHNFQFLLSSSAPIKSLDINLVLENGFQDSHIAALEYFIGGSTPGVFNCYSIRQFDRGSCDRAQFIEPADKPRTQISTLLAIPSQHLENLWLSTTILRLNGPCPPWSSQAYHGLVELRLGQWAPMIFESQLVAILASSPKLRVLHIETAIQGCTPLDHSIEPVFLEELEELDIIQEDKEFAFGNFLRWIAPGPKPLKLSFYGLPDEAGPVEFCARANVTRFFIEEFTSSESFVRMIRHSPWLEILAIKSDQNDEYNDLESILPSIDQQYPNEFAPKTQVDTLLLINFTDIFFEDIQAVVDAYSIKRLLIRRTSISYEVEGERKVTDDPQEIKAKLSTLQPLPVVEYLTSRSPHEPVNEHW